jgi:hypothetical protein
MFLNCLVRNKPQLRLAVSWYTGLIFPSDDEQLRPANLSRTGLGMFVCFLLFAFFRKKKFLFAT